MKLAAVPIAAPAIIVIVAAINEDPAPEPAAPAEIAIPVSEARETAAAAFGEIATACGEIATACGEIAAAYGRAATAHTTRTAASMSAAGKDERGIAVRGRRCGERNCRYGQAESCRCSYYYLFYIHGVPF
jgi:hypothetical protein